MESPSPSNLSGFWIPPLDGSLHLTQIYDLHATRSAKHTVFLYGSLGGSSQSVHWPQLVTAVHRAQTEVETHLAVLGHTEPGAVIPILAAADTMVHVALIMGIIRAGHIAFPISNRSSATDMAHLCRSTDAETITFVGSSQIIQDLERSSSALLDAAPKAVPFPSFESLFNGEPLERVPEDKSRDLPLETVAIILHSSGTTGVPKPLKITHARLLELPQGLRDGAGYCGQILSFHAVPMYHASGLLALIWPAETGLAVSTYEPQSHPMIPTPRIVLQNAVATGSTMIITVPAFIEEWSREPESIVIMKQFSLIMFAGAPLNNAIGRMLVDHNVPLLPVYGSTEVGIPIVLVSNRTKEAWNYFEFSSNHRPVFLPWDEASAVFRLIFVKCATHAPALINITVDGHEAYDTRDLLIRHPETHNLWAFYGRADDQITHSNGKKTNPVPIETLLCLSDLISAAVVFGSGRAQTGVLVSPASGSEANENIVDEIWSTVEKANAASPSYSRILKEMIIIESPFKPFVWTPKKSPRRQAMLEMYKPEIEAAYASLSGLSRGLHPGSTSQSKPVLKDVADCLRLSRSAVAAGFSCVGIEDDDDIFSKGCDSLGATLIRNTILRAINLDSISIPKDFVYLNPTITKLTSALHNLDTLESTAPVTQPPGVLAMRTLINRYSMFQVSSQPSDTTLNEGACVMLIGSTGSLGSYILEALLLDASVTKVFTLNRVHQGETLSERQARDFKSRGIDDGLVRSPKLVMLRGDTSLPDLGIGPGALRSLEQQVTHIISNGWRVNFRIGLESFEPLLAGVQNTINLALRSKRVNPPRYLFMSTVGVFGGAKSAEPAGALSLRFLDLVPAFGYPQSKACAEAILEKAAESTPLRPTIIRVGQLCGSRRNGSWNQTEWIPSLFKASQTIGCLPAARGIVSWLPVDIAASAIVEMRDWSRLFVHLVHPKPVPWSLVAQQLSAQLNISLAESSAWSNSLKTSELVKEDDGAHLVQLDCEESYDREVFGLPWVKDDAVVQAAPLLATAHEIDGTDVSRWLESWGRSGFIGL